MKKISLLAALLLSHQVAAEETLLTCSSSDDSKKPHSATIRYDEAENLFELRGKAMWSIRRNREGIAEVATVEYSQDLVTVKFKRRRVLWLSLIATIAGGGRVGVLDLEAGTWSLGGTTFNCTDAEAGNSAL